jgi:ABC-type lipoprotein export system ATPase subunit
MPEAIATVEGLVVRYRSQDPAVLKNLDISVARGERVAIMGPSGCGKSTLLAHMAGLRLPEAGEVRLEGRSLEDLSPGELDDLRSTTLGFVFQRSRLLPYLTVRENIEMAFETKAFAATSGTQTRVESIMDAMGLTAIARRKAGDLSVGEAQRVAVARALVKAPALVIADEPTGSLDGENVAAIAELLCDDSERAVIVATHDERVAGRCQRVLVLSDGVLHERK